MKRSVLVLVLAGVVAVAASGVAISQHTAPQALRQATISSQGLSVKGKLGSSCLPSSPSGTIVCTDVAFNPRPTRGRLPIKRGGRMSIRTGAPAKSVTVQLMNAVEGDAEVVGPNRTATRRGSTGTSWVAKLPRRLSKADVVYFFVKYAEGDASFWASVRPGGNCD